jgi:hypothetical protein
LDDSLKKGGEKEVRDVSTRMSFASADTSATSLSKDATPPTPEELEQLQ